MIKHIIYFSIFFLLLFNLALGQNKLNKSVRKEAIANVSEWTVLVYMNADNNLEEFAIKNFLDMAKVANSEKVNIIVQLDRINGYDNNYGDWTQTMRFKLGKDMTPEDTNKLEDLGEVDMGSDVALSNFVNWGIKKYPAKKYMLTIWDHGQGYRFLDQFVQLNRLSPNFGKVFNKSMTHHESNRNTTNINNKRIQVSSNDRSSNGSPYRSCSNDNTDSSELYNREIQDAMEKIVKIQKNKFDVIGFDCCLMSMVETAFAFRNVASYMVGSEELEPGEGWKYNDWLSKLIANPSMDGSQLSKLLINSYRKTYQFNDRTTTLSAIDLSKMDPVASAISEFADILIQSLQTNLKAIKKARTECTNYAPNETYPSPYYHIDFIRFCELIAVSSANPILKQKAASVGKIIKSIVIANYAGELRRGKFGSYGLAIYFPPSENAYLTDMYSEGGYDKLNQKYPVEFVDKHRWADFLHAYFKEVK